MVLNCEVYVEDTAGSYGDPCVGLQITELSTREGECVARFDCEEPIEVSIMEVVVLDRRFEEYEG